MRMSSPSRAAHPSTGERRPTSPSNTPIGLSRTGSDGRGASQPVQVTEGSVAADRAARLRASNRVLLRQIASREALTDLVRAVNTTLDPSGIASLLLDRSAIWVPAPSWTVVVAEPSGDLSVLTSRGLPPEAGPPLNAVALSVMRSSEEF